jgi:hypothetical protein
VELASRRQCRLAELSDSQAGFAIQGPLWCGWSKRSSRAAQVPLEYAALVWALAAKGPGLGRSWQLQVGPLPALAGTDFAGAMQAGGEIAPRRTFCTRHWQLRVTAARVWTVTVKRTSAGWVLAVLAPQWPKSLGDMCPLVGPSTTTAPTQSAWQIA